MRGLVVLEVLKKIRNETGKEIHELFDYICGSSTGGLIALSVGKNKNKNKL